MFCAEAPLTFTTLAQQHGYFHHRCPEDLPFVKNHYTEILRDMLGTLDRHLAEREYVTDSYSVADIAIYADVHVRGVPDIGLGPHPHVQRWHDRLWALDAWRDPFDGLD